jgi:hypothetical protein
VLIITDPTYILHLVTVQCILVLGEEGTQYKYIIISVTVNCKPKLSRIKPPDVMIRETYGERPFLPRVCKNIFILQVDYTSIIV